MGGRLAWMTRWTRVVLLSGVVPDIRRLFEELCRLATRPVEPEPAGPLDTRLEELAAGLCRLRPARAKQIIDTALRAMDVSDLMPAAREIKAEMIAAGKQPTQSTIASELIRRKHSVGDRHGVVWDTLEVESAGPSMLTANGHTNGQTPATYLNGAI
ncbi:hypothetical protein [Protofrankia symbiont of Coriaria ruscifolia]|uniref:hypothetical protein n=1 Tax=Protofrankia symbiont of Coriaria ruscifolia TaxID=1306542 RepID=UPI0010413F91|nr:hypothetical protein [Protofrankia symbiont of Coriaria ruscifolia]